MQYESLSACTTFGAAYAYALVADAWRLQAHALLLGVLTRTFQYLLILLGRRRTYVLIEDAAALRRIEQLE